MPESVLFPFVVALWAAPLAGPAISSIRSTARHAARHRHHPPTRQTRGLPSIHEGKYPSHITTNPRVCALWAAPLAPHTFDQSLDQT